MDDRARCRCTGRWRGRSGRRGCPARRRPATFERPASPRPCRPGSTTSAAVTPLTFGGSTSCDLELAVVVELPGHLDHDLGLRAGLDRRRSALPASRRQRLRQHRQRHRRRGQHDVDVRLLLGHRVLVVRASGPGVRSTMLYVPGGTSAATTTGSVAVGLAGGDGRAAGCC